MHTFHRPLAVQDEKPTSAMRIPSVFLHLTSNRYINKQIGKTFRCELYVFSAARQDRDMSGQLQLVLLMRAAVNSCELVYANPDGKLAASLTAVDEKGFVLEGVRSHRHGPCTRLTNTIREV